MEAADVRMGKWGVMIVVTLPMLALSGCSDKTAGRAANGGEAVAALVNNSQSPDSLAAGGEVSAADRAGQPAAGEWTLPARDFQGTRYSPLDQITTANASQLQVAWTFSTGLLHGHEGQPLVVNNTMYVVTPWPNSVYAIDLANPNGPLKWSYTPPTSAAAQGEACCDVVNRGASYADGKIGGMRVVPCARYNASDAMRVMRRRIEPWIVARGA